MSWVLVLIAVWVVVALAVALVIGRSIHLADLKSQAALDRHLSSGGPGPCRGGTDIHRRAYPRDDERGSIWPDMTAGEPPRTA